MPTVMTHAVVGVAAGTLTSFRARRPLFWVLSAALPMLPDLDVFGAAFGIRFTSMWGHRGITHSLLAAVIIGVVTALLTHRRLGTPPLELALYLTAITASHGVLDALTNGGVGVAFFAPFDADRYFFAWRPIPVSPIGRQFFSARGWHVVQAELLLVWLPAALVAAFALARHQRRAPRRHASR